MINYSIFPVFFNIRRILDTSVMHEFEGLDEHDAQRRSAHSVVDPAHRSRLVDHETIGTRQVLGARDAALLGEPFGVQLEATRRTARAHELQKIHLEINREII